MVKIRQIGKRIEDIPNCLFEGKQWCACLESHRNDKGGPKSNHIENKCQFTRKACKIKKKNWNGEEYLN